MLLFIIKNQVIERADNEIPVRGTIGQYAAFKFHGECWKDVKNLTVRYDCGKNSKYELMLTEKHGDVWIQQIPWEAMECPKFFVAVIGDSTTPTTAVEIRTSASGVTGTAEAPMPPTPTLYDEIMAEFDKALGAAGSIEGAMTAAQTAAEQAEASASTAQSASSSALQAASSASTSANAAGQSAQAAQSAAEQAASSADGIDEAVQQATSAAQSAVSAAESAASASESVAHRKRRQRQARHHLHRLRL